MIEIGNTLVSLALLEQHFFCDLISCKGICCVEGDAGAPLEPKEVTQLAIDYEKIKPFLTPEGNKSIEKQGTSITSEEGEPETPLINGGACAYIIKENGIYSCGIQKTHSSKAINWRKPISCYLYPIRLGKTKTHTIVNYEKWHICKKACELGEKLKMPVYLFLKQPLIEKFGENWYAELEQIAEEFYNREL